ncbi:MAG: hypothetical protein ABMA02_09675 [Saprospiraceae bacterium]
MSNPKRKSIADLIAKKTLPNKPSSAEIDQITKKIHLPEKSQSEKEQPLSLPVTEKIKRIGIVVPVSLYLKAKTKSTMQDQTLMAYIIHLIEEDVKNSKYPNA